MKTVIIILTLLVIGCSKSEDQAKSSSPVPPTCLNSKFILDVTTATEHFVFDFNCIYAYDSTSPVCSQSGTYIDTGIGQTSGKIHIKMIIDTCSISSTAGKTQSCDYTLDSFGKPLVFNCVLN